MRQFRLLQSCLVSRPARSLWPTVVPRRIGSLQIGQRTIHASRTLRVESDNLRTAIREIQDKFVEAKDEYEMALESQGTTYAVEDNETARDVAAELQAVYDGFMNGEVLSDAEKQTVKEKLSARIRELTNGVENNLHDSD